MRKLLLLTTIVALCLSLPVIAADPPVMVNTFEHGAVGDVIAFDAQTPEGTKVKIPDADGTSKISDKGVTDGTRSLEVNDTTGGFAENFLGKGLWRIWDQIPTATYISMDITLDNPGGNTTIPDQWFEVDVAFNGTLTGWATVATEKIAVAVPWSEKTFTLQFPIPQSIRDGRASAANNNGDFYIRKYHGDGGATFWIDKIQIHFDELVPQENPTNLTPNNVAVDKKVFSGLLVWGPPAWDAAVEPNILSIDYNVDYYSKSTVTADDPNFANPLNGVTSVNTDSNSLAVTLDYSTSFFWRVEANTTWDSNDITGNWIDSGTELAQFTVLADDLAPVVTIPSASDKVITWLGNLPEEGLAGTVSDEQIATVAIDWDIIAGPGIAPKEAKQSQNRSAYTADPNYTNLLQDWIGTDSRTGSGGIKTMYLILSGVPSGTYNWTSYHHDSQDQTGLFDLTITDSSGTVTDPNIDITDGAVLPLAEVTQVVKTITSNGSDDIVLAFTQQVNDPVNQSFFALNGFILDDGTTAPLMVDFGSDASKVQADYAAYTAGNEVEADFIATDYLAFGGQTVTVTPSWDDPNPSAKVVNTTTDNAAPTARFETLTNVTGTYTVQLTVTDHKGQSASDTLTVVVADHPCAAAKLTAGFALNYYDRDGDCDVDLLDFAEFAKQWLDDKELSATVFE